MTWWAWTLLWIVLTIGAGVVFFLIGRSLWRRASALLRELGTAADRLRAVSGELATVTDATEPQEAAVFADPAELRRRRYLEQQADRPGRRHRGAGADRGAARRARRP